MTGTTNPSPGAFLPRLPRARGDRSINNFGWVTAAGSEDTRTFEDWMAVVATARTGVTHVLDYLGADNLQTGATSAFERAIAAAYANGHRAIVLPPQLCFFPAEDDPIDPGVGPMFFLGTGGATILQYEEGVSKSLFYNADKDADKEIIAFSGVEFRGTFTDGETQHGGACLALDHYREIHFLDCRWFQIAFMATALHFNGLVRWSNCRFEQVARDGARARETKYTWVSDCYFSQLGDDAVAWHGGAYTELAYDPDDGSPRREGLHVSGCIFNNCSASISALGARSVNIHDNFSFRGRAAFCYITQGGSATEGTHPESNIRIANNTILSHYNDAALIYVSAEPPRATAQSSNVVPGMPATGTGTFQYIWDYQLADLDVAADAFPPVENIEISGNVIARGLPDVANFSDWGFGYSGNPTNGYDPSITDANMRPVAGIQTSAGRVTRVVGNVISHVEDGIIVVPQTDIAPKALATVISGNTVTDCTGGCCRILNASGDYVDVRVVDNDLLGDQFRQASNSNADGTYDSGFTFPRALDVDGALGVVFARNKIANVAEITSTLTGLICHDNVVIAQPVATGSSASNKGIGSILREQNGFEYIIVDCDPQSATYGELINIQENVSGSRPSSGTYVAGHFVHTNAHALGNGQVLMGWRRLTTGDAHVADVDWVTVYAQTSQGILNGSATFNPADLADGAGETTTVAVTGAALGDMAIASFSLDTSGLTITAWVSAADTVSVRFQNESGGALNIGSGTLRARVFKA